MSAPSSRESNPPAPYMASEPPTPSEDAIPSRECSPPSPDMEPDSLTTSEEASPDRENTPPPEEPVITWDPQEEEARRLEEKKELAWSFGKYDDQEADIVKELEELDLLEKKTKARQEELRKDRADRLNARNILIKLPQEILVIIFRLLLRTPATIMPGTLKYTYLHQYRMGKTCHDWHVDLETGTYYKYQWEEAQQKQVDHRRLDKYWFEPDYRRYGYAVSMTLTTPNAPTEEQLQYVDDSSESHSELSTADGHTAKTFPVPFTAKDQVGCRIVQRGVGDERFYQVVNQHAFVGKKLAGLALLRVCKKLHAECSNILYGENRFAFVADSDPEDFKHFPMWIPGAVNSKNGRPQTASRTERSIARMFAPGSYKGKFVAKDPMFKFFSRIGRVNVSRLKKVMISGIFKTAYNSYTEVDLKYVDPGFQRHLHAYITVLSLCSPQLKELTLHRREPSEEDNVWEGDRWENDLRQQRTDDEHLNEIVEDAVSRLPALRTLQLGAAEFLNKEEFEERWGTSVKWMRKVKDREVDDKAKSKEVRKQEDAELQVELARIEERAQEDVWQAYQYAPRQSKKDVEEEECTCGASSGRGRGRGRRGRGGRWEVTGDLGAW